MTDETDETEGTFSFDVVVRFTSHGRKAALREEIFRRLSREVELQFADAEVLGITGGAPA